MVDVRVVCASVGHGERMNLIQHTQVIHVRRIILKKLRLRSRTRISARGSSTGLLS
jgi:hypothetical protein